MQIGNFHFGTAQTAKKPSLTIGEAYLLWDNLLARYDILENFQIFHNYAHDPDLKGLIKKTLTNVLETEIKVFEDELNKYGVTLPKRPPKSVRFDANSGVVKDEYIFRRMFTHVQDCLGLCSQNVRVTISNDSLRDIFNRFLFIEIEMYDTLCRYGKLKGWFDVPPIMKSN